MKTYTSFGRLLTVVAEVKDACLSLNTCHLTFEKLRVNEEYLQCVTMTNNSPFCVPFCWLMVTIALVLF